MASARRPRTTYKEKTRCSAIAERPRCRVHYLFKPKVEDWKRQYFTTLQVYLQPKWYNRPENLSNSVKKTQNEGYYGVQGYSRSSRSVPIESPYAISYQWLIVTDILSRTVSELSQLIVQISLQHGHFDSKFQVQRVASHQSFLQG